MIANTKVNYAVKWNVIVFSWINVNAKRVTKALKKLGSEKQNVFVGLQGGAEFEVLNASLVSVVVCMTPRHRFNAREKSRKPSVSEEGEPPVVGLDMGNLPVEQGRLFRAGHRVQDLVADYHTGVPIEDPLGAILTRIEDVSTCGLSFSELGALHGTVDVEQ
jgi:hypothetical protein